MFEIRRIILTATVFLLLLSSVYSLDAETEFRNRNGQEWEVRVSEWDYVLFAARDEPSLMNPPVDDQQAIALAEDFLDMNKDLFGLEELAVTNIELSGGVDLTYNLWVIDYEGQYYEGIPVMDTYTKVLMQIDGQIYGVGNLRYEFDPEEETPSPQVPPGQAGAVGGGAAGTDQEPDQIAETFYVEDNQTLKPTWRVNFGEPVNKSVLVDGTNGTVLSIEDWDGTLTEIKFHDGFTMIDYVIIFLSFFIFAVMFAFLFKRRKK